MKKKLRILVVFTGSGKTKLLSEMDRGSYPRTVLHALVQESNSRFVLEYRDTEHIGVHKYLRPILGSRIVRLLSTPALVLEGLRYDILITSDTGFAPVLLSFIRKATCGILGPRWYFITVNSSVLMQNASRSFFRRTVLQIAWQLTYKIISLTEFQKNDLQEVGIPSKKVLRIPLGVDADFFSPAEPRIEEEYIFSVGNDMARDYNLLLEVAKKVPYPIVIGTSKRNIPESTLLPENVRVTYGMPILEVRERHQKAKLLLVPLKEVLDPEGSDCSGQTVVLEALSVGIPVLVTKTGWVSEYLTEHIEYVPLAQTPEAIANQIRTLWNDQDKRTHLSRSGRMAIQRKYTVQNFARTLLAVIEDDFLNERTFRKK